MIFTQALFALQMDTMLSFSEDLLPHLAFSLPCLRSGSRTEAAMVVLGKGGNSFCGSSLRPVWLWTRQVQGEQSQLQNTQSHFAGGETA